MDIEQDTADVGQWGPAGTVWFTNDRGETIETQPSPGGLGEDRGETFTVTWGSGGMASLDLR